MSAQDNNSQSNESNKTDVPAETTAPAETPIVTKDEKNPDSNSTNVDSKVDATSNQTDANIKVNDKEASQKADHKTGFITEINFCYLLIAFLVIISFIQIRQIDSLQQDNEWLAQRIDKIQNSDTPEQKFAIMSFEDTFNAWNKVDPSGRTVSKILDTTIKSYNNKGITILDSSAVIGGKGNLEFIDVTPDRYMKEQNSAEK